MPDRDALPPAPRDAWGRFHAERGSFGDLIWVRPSDLVEVHPTIIHLDPHSATDELSTWSRQPWGGRDFLLALHHQAFGSPFTTDIYVHSRYVERMPPGNRWCASSKRRSLPDGW